MTMVTVQIRDGASRTLVWDNDDSLMEVLRDAGHDVAGTCGGAMSCGTCHVYVEAADLARFAPASEDERDMLDALSDVVVVTERSRLACQLRRTADLAGLGVTVAPQP